MKSEKYEIRIKGSLMKVPFSEPHHGKEGLKSCRNAVKDYKKKRHYETPEQTKIRMEAQIEIFLVKTENIFIEKA